MEDVRRDGGGDGDDQDGTDRPADTAKLAEVNGAIRRTCSAGQFTHGAVTPSRAQSSGLATATDIQTVRPVAWSWS